jgi:hypothetical protein
MKKPRIAARLFKSGSLTWARTRDLAQSLSWIMLADPLDTDWVTKAGESNPGLFFGSIRQLEGD